MVVVLCLNDGNRVVRIDVKDVIGLLRFFAEHKITLEINFTVCNLRFHRNTVNVPFRSDCRSNKPELDIFFGHMFFINHDLSLLYSSAI
ncbi:hypothetical protein SDC9_147523 [bioreactor metagenome]|uniref:Uncharacterized protein n=1 Tax=bioreactor metagenome TaxID=1076179 RepID=A0A645EGQ8_9ZZZZ